MSIKTNAPTEDLTTKYFLANKEFCYDTESFIKKFNGISEGIYNAWYYHVKGEINNPNNWKITYKKEVIGAKYGVDTFKLAKWECNKKFLSQSKFKIRRKTWLDFIKVKLDKNLNPLEKDSFYLIETYEQDNSNLIMKIYKILKDLLERREIYEIEVMPEYLKVEIITDNQYFDILNKLIREIQKIN